VLALKGYFNGLINDENTENLMQFDEIISKRASFSREVEQI